MKFNTFRDAIDTAAAMFPKQPIHPQKWQATDVSQNPSARMHEILFYELRVPLVSENLEHYVEDIRPDIPWANDHFLERVSGNPLNPPPSEEWWPHAEKSNNKFKEGVIFSHTYPERYWPKYAGYLMAHSLYVSPPPHKGIRHPYGDLRDVINLLVREPDTRQAYLPVWFPEDTGNVNNVRLPCSIGYHFLVRDNKLHCHYYIRSCDYARHMRNDVYMTVRLVLWLVSECRKLSNDWLSISPGMFIMSIGSLHIFANDAIKLGIVK